MTESIRAADVLARSMHGPDWDISTGDLPCDCPISDALARIDKEAHDA